MENNKTVIILLCVIIAILIVGIVMFSPLMAKEKSNLTILDKKLNVGDSLTVKLTDENGKPIANQTVKIRLTDKDGVTIDEDATTNSKGKAKLKVDEKGKYDKQIGTCYFIRTKEGGWFGAYAKMFFWCELDVDNRWYNELIKEK